MSDGDALDELVQALKHIENAGEHAEREVAVKEIKNLEQSVHDCISGLKDDFVGSAQIGIIENQIEEFEEEYEALKEEEKEVEHQQVLEEQIEIWKEARDQVVAEQN